MSEALTRELVQRSVMTGEEAAGLVEAAEKWRHFLGQSVADFCWACVRGAAASNVHPLSMAAVLLPSEPLEDVGATDAV